MTESNYAPPMDRLLTLGRPEPWDLWIDYASSVGLRREHAAELIRMVTDATLLDGEDDLHPWARLHAWRALGQMAAAEAIEPLLSLLSRIEANDDDTVGEELPKVFGLIGSEAVEPLKRYATDPQHDHFARVAAVEGIKHVGRNRQHRETCADLLAELLDRHDVTDETLCAFLVIGLCDLRAKHHIGAIERAFAAGRVDEQMCGKLSHIRAELGLSRPQAIFQPPKPQLLIDMAIDEVLPPSPRDDEPQWMKEFLA